MLPKSPLCSPDIQHPLLETCPCGRLERNSVGDLQGQLDVYVEGKGKNSDYACHPSELDW